MGGEVEESWDLRPEHPAILIVTQDMLLSRALNRGYAMGPSPRARRAKPGTPVIGYDQWPFKFSIATSPEHVRALHEYQLT
jgi:hypothetical protein